MSPPTDTDARGLALLAEIVEATSSAHTEATIVTAVAEVLERHLRLRWLELGLRATPASRSADVLVYTAGVDTPTRGTLRLAGSVAGAALAEGPRVLSLADAARRYPRAPELRRTRTHGVEALASLPLRDEGEPAGYVTLALARTPSLALVDAVARVLSAALRQARVLGRVAALSRRAHAERQALRHELTEAVLPPHVVALSPAMRAVFHEAVPLVARQSTTVLVTGESGTGKEVVARRIHALSPRANRPFLKVNCGALPEGLVESALFGHERGAFTGATARHVGFFERAHGGTLLLDEVAELPLAAQVKLLRVLQEGEFERVGGQATLHTDVRVVAATHRDLERLVTAGSFRADLYYRLNIFPVTVPPLRERLEDLDALVPALLAALATRFGRAPPRVPSAVHAALRAHAWPGNVRELQNVLERALVLSPGAVLALPPGAVGARRGPPSRAAAASVGPDAVEPYNAAVRRHLATALAACGGRVYGPGGAAEVLGLKPTTLQSKLRKYGLRGTAT